MCKYYDQLKQAPKWALREITAGRLKGKTDINPQWRYEMMTMVFGTVGQGWKYEVIDFQTIPSGTGEIAAFAKINLYVCIDGKWSDAIPGVGGSMFVEREKNGMHTNDECYKMAVTDALSVAMKMLGMAADVYKGLWDGTKYKQLPEDKKPLTIDERCNAFINFITTAGLAQLNDEKIKTRYNNLCHDAGADKAEQLSRAWQYRLASLAPLEGNNA